MHVENQQRDRGSAGSNDRFQTQCPSIEDSTRITNRNFRSVKLDDETEFSQQTPLSSGPERRPISITAEK